MHSSSANYRQEGNKKFQQALDSINTGLSDCVIESRFLAAASRYHQAVSHAKTDDEKASALKNLAIVYQQCGNLKTRPPIERTAHFRDALSKYLEAIRLGQTKGNDWVTGTNTKYTICANEARDCCRALEAENETIGHLLKIQSILPTFFEPNSGSVHSADWGTDTSRFLFQRAVVYWEEGNPQEALSKLNHSLELARKSRKIVDDALADSPKVLKQVMMNSSVMTDHFSSIQELENDIHQQMIFIEVHKATKKGDELLRVALNDHVDLPMDLVWEVVDYYKTATLAATVGDKKDVEGEAVASLKLGHVFLRVLKLNAPAKKTLKHAQSLLQSLEPKEFKEAPWYSQFMKDVRKLAVIPDIEEALQAEIEADKTILNKPSLLASEFLILIYSKYPSPVAQNANPPYVLPKEITPDNKPKILLKALQHYHPDKHSTGTAKWKALVQIITVRLNGFYDRVKQ